MQRPKDREPEDKEVRPISPDLTIAGTGSALPAHMRSRPSAYDQSYHYTPTGQHSRVHRPPHLSNPSSRHANHVDPPINQSPNYTPNATPPPHPYPQSRQASLSSSPSTGGHLQYPSRYGSSSSSTSQHPGQVYQQYQTAQYQLNPGSISQYTNPPHLDPNHPPHTQHHSHSHPPPYYQPSPHPQHHYSDPSQYPTPNPSHYPSASSSLYSTTPKFYHQPHDPSPPRHQIGDAMPPVTRRQKLQNLQRISTEASLENESLSSQPQRSALPTARQQSTSPQITPIGGPPGRLKKVSTAPSGVPLTPGRHPPQTPSTSASLSRLPHEGSPPIITTKFPPARIKRIMQADEEIGKVAQVVPSMVEKALQQFLVQFLGKAEDIARAGSSRRIGVGHLKKAVLGDKKMDWLAQKVNSIKDTDGGEGKGKKRAKAEDGEDGRPSKKSRENSESEMKEEDQ